ncbi:MAG: NGG1p interacting factor NIF3 [Candidatus Omnitrophica bacterium]|nr:NGG1p interacting factor NIF3 [Candidatus Omnitrophota bacterium]
MKLQEIYRKIIDLGIEADIRGKKQIAQILSQKKDYYEKLEENKKVFFDKDALFNPFSDTRILFGPSDVNINSMIVGIDVDVEELLFVQMLKDKGEKIDLVVSHHPVGKAYASFYEVMDLQVDLFHKEGLSLGISENLLTQRKAEVERRVSSANHQRCVDIAKWLNINLLCAHTPADNLAYAYIKELMDKNKPATLGKILDILFSIKEYQDAASNNNPPKIIIGSNSSRVSKIHIEFTGGTEGPVNIYSKLSASGIDTIIAMHQSEEHFKKCKEENINVIFAPHIASDTLGMNLLLDNLEKKEKFKIYEFSGFRRFSRVKKLGYDSRGIC